MKIILKERIIEMIASLEEANRHFCELKARSAAEELFAVCQDAAIQIGNIIETHNAEPGETISYLEEYCELIYKLYTSEISEWEGILSQLNQKLTQIRENVTQHILEDKVKVVFLPYSASMWDTFDSIYLAAKKDSRFDIKVIPIPYYNLGLDGHPLKMNYEGEEINKYAQIVDFREYNFALERPDIVFIHNPYDEYNRVTRILEPFYSSNLIQYTSYLVYIPYYVSNGQTMNHLIEMPGVTNAWRVFVQNEMVREQYINAGALPEKIAALGSPKFDMVINNAKKKKKLPEEWSILRNKRIFLYNTAITDILNNRELFLPKIKYVIDIFAQFDHAALLWRPHPLSMSTMQSMTPELVNDYVEIVQRFKSSSLGVYDESGDLERAIAISDGYIGNVDSSVSQLYEVTGKPVFYISYHDSKFNLPQRWGRCFCGEVLDQKIYMYSWEYNKFLIYDEEKKTVEIQAGNAAFGEYDQYLYLRSVKMGDTLYFTSGLASQILKYGVSAHSQKWIDIGEGDNRSDCVLYQGKIYLLPVYYSDIVKVLDLKTETVEVFETNYMRQFPELKKTASCPLFDGDTVVEKTVWRTCFLGSILQKVNLKNKRITYTNVNGVQEPLCSLTFDGQYFWLAALYGSQIYKWDHKNNRILLTVTIDNVGSCLKPKKEKRIGRIYYFKGRIWVFLKREFQVIRIEAETGAIKKIDISRFFENRAIQEGQSLFSGVIKENGEFLYMFSKMANGIIKVNTKTEEALLERIPVIGLLEHITGNAVNESMCSLDEFLRWSEHRQEKQNFQYASAGEKIWNYIVEQIYR